MEINKNYKIIDNFLDKENLFIIKNVLEGNNFNWFMKQDINEFHENKKNDHTIYFYHMFFSNYNNEEIRFSSLFNLIIPIITRINMNKLLRVKGNLYPRTQNKEIHEKHKDAEYKHKGAIFYVNTNDGYTILENDIEISSIENRLLLFDPSSFHCSTSTTNSKFRINININYF